MKWIYLLLGQCASAYNCVLQNTSYTSLDIYSNNWIHDLIDQKEAVTLGFNPPKNMLMNDWIIQNGWAIEEWAKDNKRHFNTHFDPEFCKNVLRIDAHRNDGDGSNQDNYNEGGKRVRQELKIFDSSPDEWKIHFGDYIYFELLLKFDTNFKYNLTHFYHVFQLKPMNDLSHMPVFTISTIREDVYVSFNTVKHFSDKRPTFTLYKVIERSKVIGKWLRLEIFFHPVRNGETEILFIVRDLCNKTLHHNYITGKIYQDDVSPYIRPKIGQYHKYSDKLPYENSIYYANVTMKKLKTSTKHRRSLFDSIFNKPPQQSITTKTIVLIKPTTKTVIKPSIVTKTVIKPTTKTVIKPTTVLQTHNYPTQTHPIYTYPTQTYTTQTTSGGSGGNAIVNAINHVFGLNLGENVEQHSCAARHAASEPTIAYAHTVWRTGDRCQGGIGAVWSGSPDPDMAARMWLNSPPHASIIRGARRLACGSGPSSAVCIAYN
jgi:hypothetical protein